MQNSFGQKGFTFIEVVIAALILSLIVAAVVQYHASAGAAKGQIYYLKAVQTARNELAKLKALYEFDTDGSFAEFADTGSPPNEIFLFRYIIPSSIDVPSPIFNVYYQDHSSSYDGAAFLKPLGASPPYPANTKNKVSEYYQYYEEQYDLLSDDDNTDRRTYTYFTSDTDTTDQTHSNTEGVDASIAVIDDMAHPSHAEDDLIGNIGWWVENVPTGEADNTAKCKKITFVLQFWYPGLEWTEHDPEVIVLKSTFIKQ